MLLTIAISVSEQAGQIVKAILPPGCGLPPAHISFIEGKVYHHSIMKYFSYVQDKDQTKLKEDPIYFFSYGLETTFTIIKELTKIAGISSLDKDATSEFFSIPHNCPFTWTRDHHSNLPMVAASLNDFVKSVEQRVSVGGVKWSSLEQQLHPASAESAISALQGGLERIQWSYAVLGSWDAPAQV